MIKYLFLLLPLWSFGQITSYTPEQTGVANGNAAVYWPEGATHASIFIPGKGERLSAEGLYKYNSPIAQVRNGDRPKDAVVAFSPGPYSFVSVNNASYLRVIKLLKWLKSLYPLKTFSITGLSYGAADWYNYIKFASDADYVAPYSAVLMSITSESQCTDKTKLCGTDTRFKDIKLWALDGRNDSHHDKQKRYTDAMISAGYPAKWESIPNTDHCCWDVQYARKDIMDWLSGPVDTEPPLTINAGPDTTVYFPQDSLIIQVTGAPEGSDIRAMILDGGGVMDGMILRNIYKTKTTVRVYVFYNGKQAYDDIVIEAVFDKKRPLVTFYIGENKFAILTDGSVVPVI